MKKQYISWQDLSGYVSSICRDISTGDWQPDYIVGITRGGLTPATMISHWLDIPMMSLDVSLRDHEQSVSNCGMADDAFEGKNILIVDDINDSGATIKWIKNDWEQLHLPGNDTWDLIWNDNVRFAVVVDNLASDCDVDYAATEVNKVEEDVWLVFPWENFWKAKY